MKSIPLTQGKEAIVDDDWYEHLSQWKWYGSGHGAHRTVSQRPQPQKTIFMHRVIMDAPPGMEVDHIDGDPLNNQIHNLRLCTKAENQHNQKTTRAKGTSQYKGVHRSQTDRKWRAAIRVSGQKILLGRFVNEEDAARAYDRAAIKHFGEFARLNFPKEAAE